MPYEKDEICDPLGPDVIHQGVQLITSAPPVQMMECLLNMF
jgi:hypothetical protein